MATSTATRYTDIPLSTSTAMLTYTSVFNRPLKSPAKTHVLPKVPSTFTFIATISHDLHFSNLVIPFLCITHSLSWVTIWMLNPLTSTERLQHSTWAVSVVQNIMTHWQINMSRRVSSYTVQNRNNHLHRGSHWTIPWQPNYTQFSQRCCCTIKVCNIFVLRTVFFLEISALHPISRLLPLP